MVNIKASKKTHDELKIIKDREELKSLDGAIRYILSTIPSFRNMRHAEYETIFHSGAEYPVVHFRVPIKLPIKQKNTSDGVSVEIDDGEIDCAIRFLEDLKRVRLSR